MENCLVRELVFDFGVFGDNVFKICRLVVLNSWFRFVLKKNCCNVN